MARNEITKTNGDVAIPKYNDTTTGYQTALQAVDDVILKNYITGLSNLEVVPIKDSVLKNNLSDNVLFFKINEMVYEKDEFASYKFASVFNSLATIKSSIFVIIDSDGISTDFYMGVRSLDNERTTSSLKNTLQNAMAGQFPGIKTTNYTIEEMQSILDDIKTSSISAVSCVANSREENMNKNEEFVQGLEKLVISMKGQKYTGVIIANTTDQQQLHALRKGYESIYTQLSPFATMQINYGQNASYGINESTATTISKSYTDTLSTSDTDGTTDTTGTTTTHTKTKNSVVSTILNGVSKVATVLAGASAAGATAGAASAITAGTLAETGVLLSGGAAAAGGIAAGGVAVLSTAALPLAIGGAAAALLASKSGSVSDSTSQNESHSVNRSHTTGTSTANTQGTSDTHTYGTSTTNGSSNAITLTAHDKSIENILERIDKQIKRMDEFESLGMYECAAYFMSDDQYASEMAATTYKAIIGGENTGVEISTVNSWGLYDHEKTALIEQYIKNFIHPVFKYNGTLGNIEVTPCSMVSGNELAIHMGLPRKSVCGLPVIEHSDFGKEVVNYDGHIAHNGINLGKVFNMGSVCPNNVILDKNSLTMHTFVTGSTGSGKSNTIYELIRQCNNLGAKFLIIEPAKGEYKHVFGNRPDVSLFGTNPQYSDLLRINPFKFAKGIHVLEHIDRLIEIFNVCWPMYAAMPAVLKDALLRSYEDCGWDLAASKNNYDDSLYPTFADLQEELVEVISTSAYSEEVKSNYTGSLVTRVSSLTNGLNGQIFTSNEIADKILFDENVIIDLSRIGSLETKALIMGVIIMKLSEYRMSSSSSMNIPFKHLTILEEAHNILKRTSTEQNPENPSVAGKSVEMISNAIAEMRTYGEGFVIVDQSPSAVDISAIRNTNTKIIMRLPDESDRRLAGKSAGLRDDQLDEIAKLPKGVAVVYQNDWIDPVLCKIQKFKGNESPYVYKPMVHINRSTPRLKQSLLELLLKNRVNDPIDTNTSVMLEDLNTAEIPTKSKLVIKKILNEYKLKNELSVWNENNFNSLCKLVNSILNGDMWVKQIINSSSEFDMLTDRLIANIRDQAKELPAEYALAAAQCMMWQEVDKDKDNFELYSAWITDLKKKGVF